MTDDFEIQKLKDEERDPNSRLPLYYGGQLLSAIAIAGLLWLMTQVPPFGIFALIHIAVFTASLTLANLQRKRGSIENGAMILAVPLLAAIGSFVLLSSVFSASTSANKRASARAQPTHVPSNSLRHHRTVDDEFFEIATRVPLVRQAAYVSNAPHNARDAPDFYSYGIFIDREELDGESLKEDILKQYRRWGWAVPVEVVADKDNERRFEFEVINPDGTLRTEVAVTEGKRYGNGKVNLFAEFWIYPNQ